MYHGFTANGSIPSVGVNGVTRRHWDALNLPLKLAASVHKKRVTPV